MTLPITALSSIMGMNVIVSDSTHWGALWLLVAVMGVMSVLLLIWAAGRAGGKPGGTG